MSVSPPYPVIIPCGGKSSRMGTPKGLMGVNGCPWIEMQLSQLRAVGVSRAIIVLGFDADRYLSELPWMQSALLEWSNVAGIQVMVVKNLHPEFGPFTSLQTAIHHVESLGEPAAFFLPIDVPCPDVHVWRSLVCECEGVAAAVIPSHAQHGGHPVVLTRELMMDLLKVPMDAADARLDLQLKKQRHLAYVDVDDPKVGMNINTPEDFDSMGVIARP